MTRKDAPKTSYPCRAKCPGGNPCVCRTWPGSTHKLHICHRADCQCHSRKQWNHPNRRSMRIVDPRTSAIREIHMDLETYDNLIDLMDIVDNMKPNSDPRDYD